METAALSPSSHDGQAPKMSEQKPDNATATAPASALTPPTSEEMNTKMGEDIMSDLSELEDDEEEITPDHYYDGGKIPVFKPTMDQFRSFKKYVEKIDKYGMKAGIVKVIPPKEWHESLSKLDELIKTIKIKNPIMQEFMGTHGTYTQANIEKQRSYNLPEWKSLTEETQNQPPARRGERRRNQEKVVRGGGNLRGRSSAQTSKDDQDVPPKRKPGRPRRNPPKQETTENDASAALAKVPPTPTSPEAEEVQQSIEKKQDTTPAKAKKPRGRPAKGNEQKSVTSRRMNNTTEKADVIDEAAFEDFDYHLDHLDEFTPERCAELETAYWKSLTFAQPMYAADMPGSLFTDNITSWNVSKLENLLDVLGTKVPGVNTAYLYLGMWKATFAWHLEDVDLYSINYIHFGAPKQWYSISQEDARRFEAAMRNVWPNDSKHCDQFLRHKTYLISPQLLKDRYNITVNKLVHHEGEFVITYPYGYHSGYNLGYNCAESVNFALESWLDYGRIARKCECEADSVWVSVDDIERKLRGEPTPEYYEETDDDDDGEGEDGGELPTPPASVAGKSKGASRKRKRDVKEKDTNQKKKKKRIRIKIKAPTREPCVLCPHDAPYEPLLPTDNGKKAHRSCALYIPETWIAIENGVETAFGVTGVDKARLDLKCNYCRSRRGACFQCASKKCVRAFHATCAITAGVQIDAGPVPTFGEDGTEYYEEGFDLRCKYHRPKRAKNLDSDARENSRLINNYAKALKPNDVIQVQYPGSDIFAGLVLESRPSELSVLVEVLPDGDRVEVEWKWIVVLDPEDSVRPKPSASAIPMPEGMNKKSVSIENRQDGVPKMDEPFHDNDANKWAEFVSVDIPPTGYRTSTIKNKEQAKVHMDATDQVYFYLPSHSTESKDKYGDSPTSKWPCAKAEFLERVRPAAAPVNRSLASQPPNSHRPYAYKPKHALDRMGGSRPTNVAQDTEAHDARRSSFNGLPIGVSGQLPPLRPQLSNSSRGTPDRQFPEHEYYSSKVLPAAYPGQYSSYTQHVRQNSGSENNRRLSFGLQSHYTQSGNAPVAPMIGMSASPYAHAHPPAHQNPPQSLQPAPHFTPSDNLSRDRAYSGHSITSTTATDQARQSNSDWTPPSKVFHEQVLDRARFPPHETPATTRPQAVHQTFQDFQQQLSQHAQTSSYAPPYSRQENMMRQLQSYGNSGYMSAYSIQNPHTNFQSPKAPTASPLSETNTPNGRAGSPSNVLRWGGLAANMTTQHPY